MTTGTPQNQLSFFSSGGLPSPADILRRERGQAWVRVFVSFGVGVWLVAASYPHTFAQGVPFWFAFVVVYTLLATVWALSIRHAKTSVASRRYAANACDVVAITYLMVAAGPHGIPLFALYLWVTLGNGFRYGVPALYVSASLSVAAFTFAIFLNPAWQTDTLFFWAVLASLVIVPLGAARMINRLRGALNPKSVVSFMNRTGDFVRRYFPSRPKAHLPSDVLKRERGQAVLRVIMTAVATTYVLVASWPIQFDVEIPAWLLLGSGYTVFAILMALRVYTSSNSPSVRRYIGNIGDVTAISYGTFASGEAGIPLFALYLWITFGNGFRFGTPALIVSTVLSVIGFSVVVALSPVWQAHTNLVAGVYTSLLILPIYAGHLLALLNNALARANEANVAKGKFLARMSHELRTPLNGIRGSVELLRGNRRLLPDERALLDVIDDSVGLSLRQINNVLDFSKLEAGKLILDADRIDLYALLNNVVAMVRPVVVQKRLRLLLRIGPNVPCALIGDDHQVRAVLLNLVSNAIKFTERGFVSIDVASVSLRPESARIRFEVVDTGVGIAPAALPHIFESFSQEDTSTTRRFGGTGLGTTIAKQLVELMGGEIGVQSVKGCGTVFWFEIPFARQAKEVDLLPPPHASVMLISNNDEIAKNFSAPLPRQLLIVDSEEAAIEALARSMRLGNPFWLILVDQALALDASGAHRLFELPERASVANIPLMWVSDNAPPEDRLREWGYVGTLPLGVAPEQMFAAIHASPRAFTGVDPKVVSIAPWAWGSQDGIRPRVLVADDSSTNLMITRRMLEYAGYDVDTVETGEAAAERLGTGRYRMAVLDMHMPGLDGPEVVRRYRALRPRSRLPIIMLTADATVAAQQACAEAGADAYLAKPVTTRDLLNEVKRLLQDSTIEVLPTNATDAIDGDDVKNVIDVSVLAELDRIYRDPDEFEALIQGYEREGRDVLARLVEVCKTRNHAKFCDVVHALKSNAANVGARQLMELCRSAGAMGVVEFIRNRDRILSELDRAFADSVTTLRHIAAASPNGRRAGN